MFWDKFTRITFKYIAGLMMHNIKSLPFSQQTIQTVTGVSSKKTVTGDTHIGMTCLDSYSPL
jgi:hypothetical protein